MGHARGAGAGPGQVRRLRSDIPGRDGLARLGCDPVRRDQRIAKHGPPPIRIRSRFHLTLSAEAVRAECMLVLFRRLISQLARGERVVWCGGKQQHGFQWSGWARSPSTGQLYRSVIRLRRAQYGYEWGFFPISARRLGAALRAANCRQFQPPCLCIRSVPPTHTG